MDLIANAVARLGYAGVVAVGHRRWMEPVEGAALAVISMGASWSPTRTSAEAPSLVVMIYARPSQGQADAEDIALEAAGAVRRALHKPQGTGAEYWGTVRVLQALQNGSGAPGEVEGQAEWVGLRMVFELLTG